jgi:hypothetical protein
MGAVALCAVALGLCLPGAAHAERLGLLPVSPADAAVDEALQKAAQEFSGADVLPPAEMRSQVEAAASLGVECAAHDVPCFARLAGLASLDAIVVVYVSDAEVELRLIRKGETTLSARAKVAWDADDLDTSSRGAMSQLFSRTATEARLLVETVPPGADVRVDGQVVATTPMEEPLVVTPGVHDVTATKPGFRSRADGTEARVGETVTMTIELWPVDPSENMPEEDPAYLPGDEADSMPWLLIGGGTVAGVGAVLGTLSVGTMIAAELEAQRTGGGFGGTREIFDALRVPVIVGSFAGVALLAAGGGLMMVDLLNE